MQGKHGLSYRANGVTEINEQQDVNNEQQFFNSVRTEKTIVLYRSVTSTQDED